MYKWCLKLSCTKCNYDSFLLLTDEDLKEYNKHKTFRKSAILCSKCFNLVTDGEIKEI